MWKATKVSQLAVRWVQRKAIVSVNVFKRQLQNKVMFIRVNVFKCYLRNKVAFNPASAQTARLEHIYSHLFLEIFLASYE